MFKQCVATVAVVAFISFFLSFAQANVVKESAPLHSTLPDLPEPTSADASFSPTKNGSLRLRGALDGTHFSIMQNLDQDKGAPFDLDMVTQQIPATTLGWLVSTQSGQIESVLNMGWRFEENQQLLFSAAQLHGAVDWDTNGHSLPKLNQISHGLNYRYFVDKKWLSGVELSAYASNSASQWLLGAMVSEEDGYRVAGSHLYGMRLGVEAHPVPSARLKFGFGRQRLSYDSLFGAESENNINTSIKWSQILLPTLQYNASVEASGLERHLTTGVDMNWRDGHQFGLRLAHTRWNDGQVSKNAVQFAYTWQFGKKFNSFQPSANQAPWRSSLIPEVLERPDYLPQTILSKPDLLR